MMSQVDLFVSICNYKRIWYATDGCVLVCLTFLVFSWVFPVGLLSTVGIIRWGVRKHFIWHMKIEDIIKSPKRHRVIS